MITYNLLQAIKLLANAVCLLADKAIANMTINAARMAELVQQTPMLVTALSPVIGYERAAQIAKQAYAQGQSVRDVAAATTELSAAELEQLLDPRRLLAGGIVAAHPLPERDQYC